MKIALITPGITPYVMGGMQRHSFNLARHLARLGVEVDLYHTDFGDAKGIDDLEGVPDDERKKIASIAIPWPKDDRLPGHYIRKLKRFSNEAMLRYQQRRPVDFIIGKSLTAWSFVEARRRGADLPPVGVNLHGFEMYQPPASFKSRMEAWLMRPSFGHHVRHADHVFSYGGRITDLVKSEVGIPPERIIEIPGGIDDDWLSTEASAVGRPIKFVFLGRYERRKGIEELHEVVAANRGWADSAHFRFVGPIPEEKRMKLDHVSYAGGISSIELLQGELRQSDVLICPSHSEGMPNSIMEGMGSGLAVIATDVGAVRLLVDSENGVLLPKVSTTGLADAIERLISLSDRELESMKNRSLDRVKEFTWERIARQTLAALEKLVSAKSTQ